MLQVQTRDDETQRPQSAPNEAASMARHLFPSLDKRSLWRRWLSCWRKSWSASSLAQPLPWCSVGSHWAMIRR